MMETLFEVTGKLKNGQPIKIGDVVKAQCGPYITFQKVFDKDGHFHIVGPGPWCFEVAIDHFENQGNSVEVIKPIDVYRFCKANGWESGRELIKFR